MEPALDELIGKLFKDLHSKLPVVQEIFSDRKVVILNFSPYFGDYSLTSYQATLKFQVYIYKILFFKW